MGLEIGEIVAKTTILLSEGVNEVLGELLTIEVISGALQEVENIFRDVENLISIEVFSDLGKDLISDDALGAGSNISLASIAGSFLDVFSEVVDVALKLVLDQMDEIAKVALIGIIELLWVGDSGEATRILRVGSLKIGGSAFLEGLINDIKLVVLDLDGLCETT